MHRGHDAPRLIDQPVPDVVAKVDDVVVKDEYPVGQPVIAHEALIEDRTLGIDCRFALVG